jgi:hypothetical protein
LEDLKVNNHLENRDAATRIIRCILGKRLVRMWSGLKWRAYVISVMNIQASLEGEEFLDCLSDYWLLKRHSVLVTQPQNNI